MSALVDRKALHCFGSLEKAQAALAEGKIQTFDLLFLNNKTIGWVDRNGEIVIAYEDIAGPKAIQLVDALPALGREGVFYIYDGEGYVWNKTEFEKIARKFNTYTKAEVDDLFATKASLENKVDVEDGKGLSANDLTDALKAKLDGVSEGATKTSIVPTVTTGSELAKITIDGVTTSIYGSANDFTIDVDSALSNTSTNPVENKVVNNALYGKVDKVTGKGLSTNDYTTEDKTKLTGVEEGAEVNVQADWTETSSASDAFILHKPTLGEAAEKSVADILDEIDDALIIAKLGYTPIDEAEKGVANGVATLSASGIVPDSQLPSYVSEIKSFAEMSNFPATGSDSIIYYDSTTNTSYRWNGTAYTEISKSLALGETASTAYAGNKGKIAYDHALAKGSAFATGLYKFQTNAEGHVVNTVPVTAADIEALGISGGDGGTTYTAGTGISITGTAIANAGVRAVTEGATNGAISVNTNGTTTSVAVHGLGTAAYKADTYFVPAETGKGLSANDFTNTLKSKLDGIKDNATKTEYTASITSGDEIGILTIDGVQKKLYANKNVQADWNQTDTTKDDFIKNKPTIYTKAETDTELAKKADKGTKIADYGITDAYTKAEVNDLLPSYTLTKTNTTNAAGDTIPQINLVDKDGAVISTIVDATTGTAAGGGASYTLSVNNATVTLSGDDGSGNSVTLPVYTKTETDTELAKKVDAVTGKGLSTNDLTDALKAQYDKAEENVQSDWNQTNSTKDDFIKNKPTIPTKVSELTNDSGFLTEETKYTLTKSGSTIKLTGTDGSSTTVTDDDTTYEAATTSAQGLMTPAMVTKLNGIEDGAQVNVITKVNGKTGDVTIDKTDVGLSDVENLTSAGILAKMTKAQVTTALGGDVIMLSEKGVAKGVAELDTNGKVPASQLPSYLSEIKEFASQTAFPAAGDSSIIYVASDTLVMYRWSGSAYVPISNAGGGGGAPDSGLVLGNTSTTAFDGARGLVAYNHATAKGSAFAAGLYKITTNAEGHVTAATAVAKADITALGIPESDTVTTATTTGTGNAVTAISAANGAITVTKGKTFLEEHPTVALSANTTSTNAPKFGETFTAVTSVTQDTYGHITKVNTSTVTVPATMASKTTDGLMSKDDFAKLVDDVIKSEVDALF